MTTPPRPIDVDCPNCGTRYSGFVRPSINRNLGEDWTTEEIEEATTTTCPTCGHRVNHGALIVGAPPTD